MKKKFYNSNLAQFCYYIYIELYRSFNISEIITYFFFKIKLSIFLQKHETNVTSILTYCGYISH